MYNFSQVLRIWIKFHRIRMQNFDNTRIRILAPIDSESHKQTKQSLKNSNKHVQKCYMTFNVIMFYDILKFVITLLTFVRMTALIHSGSFINN